MFGLYLGSIFVGFQLTSADIKKALSVKHSKDYFITECKSGPTWFSNSLLRMDAVAIRKSWANGCITVYEIKTSRADFLSDDKWVGYMKFCDCFYFACPKGIITKKDIEAFSVHGVGLVYVNDNGYVHTVVKALNRQIPYDPDFLMYIIMNAISSDRIPFYSKKADYFRDWLANREDTWALGREVSTALVQQLSKVQREFDKLRDSLSWNSDKEFREKAKELLGLSSKYDIEMLARNLKVISEMPKGLDTLWTVMRLLRTIREEIDPPKLIIFKRKK